MFCAIIAIPITFLGLGDGFFAKLLVFFLIEIQIKP
jgi:hypothetical protein